MTQLSLSRSIQILIFFFLLFGGLYITRAFLVPVTFGMLLAMLLLPVSKKLELIGMPRGIAALLCILLMVGVVLGVGAILSWQLSGIADDFYNIKGRILQSFESAEQYISQTIGIAPGEQEQMLKQQQQNLSGNVGSNLLSAASMLTGILGNMLLTIVYIFLFIFYRDHLKRFVLKLVSATHKEKAEEVMRNAGKVAEQYLSGLGLMIVSLWIMYGIGFSIVGIKHALFFAVLCGILEIVPYVGNITGTLLTVLMAVTQGGGSGMVIGVLLTYGSVQTFQTYVLEPLVVGSRVNINPLFTIMGIIAGEMVWGVAGMILAIPMMGIAKIILDHIEVLKPIGYLIGSPPQKKKK